MSGFGNLHGAILHADGIPGWVPIVYFPAEGGVPGWWQAVVTTLVPGDYATGQVLLPSGEPMPFGIDPPALGVRAFTTLTLVFPDDRGVGAELTRRMVELAA